MIYFIKKIIFTLSFVSFSIFCCAQGVKLNFSSLVLNSQDTSIQAIAKLWKNYLNSIKENQSDSIQKSFWYNNSDDLIKYWNGGDKIYDFGEQFTFSIRKYSDTIYEIHTLYLMPFMREETNVILMYKVCAIKTSETFKLVNYFDINKLSLQNYKSESVEFYYPSCGFDFDIEKANNAEKFIKQFKNDYQIKETDRKIICLTGNSLNESNAIMGFDFSIATSDNKFAGYTLCPNTVVTCRPDHIHEFVHAIMMPEYSHALSILHEGIATYYGGTAGLDYEFHRNYLSSYIRDNAIDFSDLSSFKSLILNNNTYVLNTVGATIIEYTLKNYGHQKVIDLFSSKDYDAVFVKLDIKKKDINNFLIQLISAK